MAGREYATPDDVARMAPAVLRHRLILQPRGRARALPPRRRGADGARRRARPAVSATPRAALVLAIVALSALVLPSARGGACRGCAVRRRARRRAGGAGARRGSSARSPAILSRGVASPLTRGGRPRRARAACACGSRACPTWRSSRRRATAASMRASCRAGAGRHVLPAVAGRATGPLGLGAWHHARRRAGRAARVPGPARRAAARARRAPGPLPRGGPPHTRAARARHGVRVDPRVPARRRHPPGQLARHRAHRPPDEQPVPDRAGPRGGVPDRRRPADERADRRPHPARRGASTPPPRSRSWPTRWATAAA